MIPPPRRHLRGQPGRPGSILVKTHSSDKRASPPVQRITGVHSDLIAGGFEVSRLSFIPATSVVVSFNVVIKGIRQDWSTNLGGDKCVCAVIISCVSP